MTSENPIETFDNWNRHVRSNPSVNSPLVETTAAPSAHGDPIAQYEAYVARLEKEGDPAPEKTIATKFPDLHGRYLAAVNAKK